MKKIILYPYIIYRRNVNDYSFRAACKGKREMGEGYTISSAIGNLLLKNPELFGVSEIHVRSLEDKGRKLVKEEILFNKIKPKITERMRYNVQNAKN